MSHKTAGLYRYEVRADALPGEVTTVNNTAPLLLRVVDQPIRVLLLEGKPYWDTKFLVRTLVGRSVDRVDQRGATGRRAAAVATKSRANADEGESGRPRVPQPTGKRPTKAPAAAAAGDRDPHAPIASNGRSRRTPASSSPTPTPWQSIKS